MRFKVNIKNYFVCVTPEFYQRTLPMVEKNGKSKYVGWDALSLVESNFVLSKEKLHVIF